jgi:hypothetical protein
VGVVLAAPFVAILGSAPRVPTGCGGWRVQSTPRLHDFQLLRTVSAVTPTDVWAGGVFVDFDSSLPEQPLMDHWDGAVWSEIDGRDLVDGGTVWGVDALDGSNVWVVGGRGDIPGRTLVEHWDGVAWSVVPSPSPGQGSTGSSLLAVSVVATDDVWAVGLQASGDLVLTLVEHWDGTEWSMVTSPNVPGDNTNELFGVSAVAPTDVWAVGFAEPDVGAVASTLTMHWDGLAWRIVPSPNVPELSNSLRGVSAASPAHVWAVGTSDAGLGRFKGLVERWDGSRWRIVSAPYPGSSTSLFALTALPSDNIWVSGIDADGPVGMHRGGGTWRVVPGRTPGDLSNQFLGVSALGDRSVWAVGQWANPEGPVNALVEYFC